MVINQFNGKIKKFIGFSIMIGSLFANKHNNLYAGEMPTNPAVQSGQATITGTGTNHLQVNTKTNKTRPLPIKERLKLELDLWKQHTKPESDEEFIFKGRFPKSHLKRQSFDKALRKYSPFPDIATHTFRRSVLTDMKRKGIPLDVICKISGHADIKTLQIYLGIDEADLHAAVAAL